MIFNNNFSLLFQESSDPFRAILEIVINYLLQKSIKGKVYGEKMTEKSRKTLEHECLTKLPQESELGTQISNLKDSYKNVETFPDEMKNSKTSHKSDKLKNCREQPRRGLETFDAAPVRRSHRAETHRKLLDLEPSLKDRENKESIREDDLQKESVKSSSSDLEKARSLPFKKKSVNKELEHVKQEKLKTSNELVFFLFFLYA